jgi:hypothetical protein
MWQGRLDITALVNGILSVATHKMPLVLFQCSLGNQGLSPLSSFLKSCPPYTKISILTQLERLLLRISGAQGSNDNFSV